MEWLIWSGAVLSAAGLAGLIWCIAVVLRARRKAVDDKALRETVRRMVPVNMACLLASVLGLMMVIMGIFLA
ncbi:hypothetical protein [Citreimonas salinaria]|uniref:Uncharacterized protein n=1 Tax=Citreimonas salinaria TaxID=321339 RepID=A0A1H3JNR7_9RHOB|nr:hypothetical protein [Citreimonas salinaria]SDY41527.1 hypothetical protein SAMN05444340_107151 [Citreimonas salinaria]